jgi:sec-independent protein translocase protein TatA
MFDVGGGELLLIILAIIVLFGPKKIPEVAQMVNKGIRKVRTAQAQFQSQIQDLEREIKKSTDININSDAVPKDNKHHINPHPHESTNYQSKEINNDN